MSRRTPNLDELDDEIREHIEAETLENLARGMSRDDAHAAALRKFGNITRVKEDVRDVWFPRWAESIRQDGRDALRQLSRNPGLASAIIVTVALGIGLTTAIFSVVNAVLIRPLAFPEPDRVVWLTTRAARDGNELLNSIDFGAWQAQATSFSHMVAYGFTDATLVAGGEASRVRIVSATDGFWEITGAHAVLGNLPTAGDRQVVVLAHHAFRDRFGGDPAIIGRPVTIDGQPAIIGGVLPESFAPQLPAPAWRPGLDYSTPEAYRSMVLDPPPRAITPTSAVRVFLAIGLLKPGVSIEQAAAEADAIHSRHQREAGTPFGKSTAVITPLRDRLVGMSRSALGILLAAAICVLGIACANVANLLMSRSAARQKEIALRISVGSGALRIVRQLLAESVAYALVGTLAGLLLSRWLINIAVQVIGPAVPRLTETTMDLRVLSFAVATAAATALLFGLGPAISLCRTNVQEVLKEGSRNATAPRRSLTAGRFMVALQVSLTIVLLAGAGLMVKSVWQMTSYPAGFAPGEILTLRVDFRGLPYRDEQARHNFANTLLSKIQSLPGVRQAAISTGRASTMVVIKEGESMPADRNAHSAMVNSISSDFGQMLGMSIVSGRWLDEVETPGALLVNETLARREFPNGDAVGRRIRLPWVGSERFGTIVGVVSDLKYAVIDADVVPEIFTHHADSPLFGVLMAVRIDGDPMAAAPSIARAVATIDPTQAAFSVRTLEAALDESIAPRRFNLLLLGTFAAVALLLAVLGVYAVIASAVAARRHEIGVRLALGAERRQVFSMVMTDGMRSVLAGLVVGLLGALSAARVMSSLLYGVGAYDAATFVAATMLLAAVAFLACAAPALRAAVVDPATALRAE